MDQEHRIFSNLKIGATKRKYVSEILLYCLVHVFLFMAFVIYQYLHIGSNH